MFFTYFLKVHLVTLGNILDMGSIRSIGSSSISCTTCIPYVLNSPSKTTTIFLLFYFYTELLFICVFYRTEFYLKHFFRWLKNFMVNWQSGPKKFVRHYFLSVQKLLKTCLTNQNKIPTQPYTAQKRIPQFVLPFFLLQTDSAIVFCQQCNLLTFSVCFLRDDHDRNSLCSHQAQQKYLLSNIILQLV